MKDKYLGDIQKIDFAEKEPHKALNTVATWIRGKGNDIAVEDIVVNQGEEFGYWRVVVYYREYK